MSDIYRNRYLSVECGGLDGSIWKNQAITIAKLTNSFTLWGEQDLNLRRHYTNRFTVCPSWPLWYLPVHDLQSHYYGEPMEGFEPPTS